MSKDMLDLPSIVPLSDVVGAEVVGVDISQDLLDDIFQQVLDAWYSHCVILLRGQKLSKESLIKFSARLGTPEVEAPQGARADLLSGMARSYDRLQCHRK